MYEQRLPEVFIAEHNQIKNRLRLKSAIDRLQRDASKVRILRRQRKNDQIDQTMYSNKKKLEST